MLFLNIKIKKPGNFITYSETQVESQYVNVRTV